MKAKIEALNKTYLVEFKDEDQFVSFLTKHNDDVNNVEIINEESLPELNKPVEVAKPSMSDGWKTLEKSAFVQKEKGVEKKGMTLGGKYAEFKYEPDKTLDASADDKVSEPKNDSPALTGDEPKAANVESTAKENEVKNTTPKTDAPKKEETKAEPAKEESPKTEESKEETTEDKEESSEEDKEEKKEDIDESVDAEINEVLESAGIIQEDGYVANFGKLVGGKGTLNDYGAWLDYDYNANKSDVLKSLKVIANNASKLKMSGDSRTDRRYDVYPVRFNHEIIDKVHELEEKARNGKEDLIPLYKQVSELFKEDFVGVFHFMKRFLGMHEQWQPNWIDESDWNKFADSCAAACILNAGAELYHKNRKKIKESVEEIDVDDEGDEESFQVWIIDRENGNKFSECVSIEYNKEDAIEEAKRVYNESKSNDKVVFVNYSETGETIFSLGAESENKVIESEEDDYDRGYEQGKFDWEAGQFVTYEDRDVKGESDKEDAESEEFWKGYDEGYEDAKTNYNDLDGEEELDDDEEKLNEDTDSNVEYKVTDGEGNEKSFTSLDDLNNFLINDQGLLGEDEYLETEEDFRRFEKSTEDGAELHIEKIDYNSDENNGADMVDNDLNEVMEAAGVETPIKIDEERLKTAKQWVIQNIIKLQYVDRNKITSAKQKNSIVSLLSRAASRAWGIPYKTILNSIIEEKNKKAENIKESVQVGRYKYQTVSDLIAELQQCDPNAVVIVSEKWGRGAAQFAIKQGYTDNKFLEYIGSKEQTEEFPTKAIEISANL